MSGSKFTGMMTDFACGSTLNLWRTGNFELVTFKSSQSYCVVGFSGLSPTLITGTYNVIY